MAHNSNLNASGGDNVSAGSGQTATSRLDIGRVYTGTITATHHGDNLYTVLVDRISIPVDCRWAVGFFSPIVGIKTHYYPPVNSKVTILAGKDGANWIIGSLPSEKYDAASGSSKTMTGMGEVGLTPYESEKSGLGLSTTPPNDLLEGEFTLANDFGVAMQFLTTMIKMQASDRAKVEAFIMDDMVRIVSNTFKHYNAFGDFQIYNDGRLNCRYDGTSYEHEAAGLADPSDTKAEVASKQIDYQKTFNETGRWRFSNFVGFLGDFIHMFVSEPAETLTSIAADALRPGKARIHVNNDGSILMQSVTEVAIERVCRIAVPVEKRRHDDPEGNKADTFDNLNKSFLRIWNYGKDMKTAHHAAYQLREYARWLAGFHSYARFHQLDNEWTIPKETEEAAQHSWNNKEKDVEDINSGKTEFYDAYATIRIMRDGSIVVWDTYGSAVSMVHGDLQLSASRHIILDAAGDIRMTAGQNIYIKARRNIEIAAIAGGLTLKARAWWKALCEWGTVWIKSDAVDPQKESPPSPDDATQDPEPVVMAAAIVLESSKGQTLLQSERRTTISAIGQPDSGSDITDTTASVLLQSAQQDVRNFASRHVILKTLGAKSGQLIFDAERGKAVVMKCVKFLASVRNIFDIDSKFTIKQGVVNSQEVRTDRAHFSKIITGPDFQGHDIASSPPYCSHNGHIAKFSGSTPELGGDVSERDAYSSSDVTEVKPHEDNGDPTHGPDWEFFNDDSKFKNGDEDEEVFQPLAQQRIAAADSGDPFTDPDAYADWTWATDDKLKEGTRTKTSSLPYPGIGAKEKIHTGGAPLHTPLDEEYKDQTPDIATELQNEAIVRKYLKYP